MAYTIFPLFGIRHTAEGKVECACSNPTCDKPGKHPACKWGELVAGEQRKGPAGHGLVTGVKSGVFVVDTDGEEADRAFLAMGEVPATFVVRTPSGGRHYYFRWPGFPVATTQGKLGQKIDIRGDRNGYVVLPGSPHKSGRQYVEENRLQIASAPAWLLEWPGLRGVSVESETATDNTPFPVDVSTDLGKERVRLGVSACIDMPASVAGENGSLALFNLAIELIRTLELPVDTAAQLVADIYNPRCNPPWTPNEVLHKLLDARDKSDRPCGMVTPMDLSKAHAPTKAKDSKRRKKNPNHTYTAHIGDVGNIPPTKTSLGKVLDILFGSVEEWEGVLQYDAFRDRIVAVDPPIRLQAEATCFAEHDTTAVRKWFETVAGLVVSKDTAWDAVISVARENQFHPVKDYLQSLPPGNPADLDLAARVFFGSDDALDRVLVRKFLIGAVRRILNPGEKLDTMLVLVGKQGAGKSTFVTELFGREFTSEDLADLKTKDAMIGLAGKWAIEVAELDKILRTEAETVKAFLSRCVDPYRAPYERVSTDHPRQCVYVGTTNKDDFLRDPTGERRYWIVRSERVDLAAVRAWRDRLWAAAYVVAQQPKADEPHWLNEQEAEALKYRAAAYKGQDGWTVAIMSYCAGRNEVRPEEIFKGAIASSTGLEKFDKGVERRITAILTELGCEAVLRSFGAHGRIRVWIVPAVLRDAEVPKEEAARREGASMVEAMLGKVG